MADQKVKVFDGTSWKDIETNAYLPISNETGTVTIQPVTVSSGDQLTVVIDAVTRFRMSDNALSLYSEGNTTFYNYSTSRACFETFRSKQPNQSDPNGEQQDVGCFIGTESYAPFVVKDAFGTQSTLLKVISSGQCISSSFKATGGFYSEFFTTVSALPVDPKITFGSNQSTTFSNNSKDVMSVGRTSVDFFIPIDAMTIRSQDSSFTNARIDLGEEFQVSKGDTTTWFKINAATGAGTYTRDLTVGYRVGTPDESQLRITPPMMAGF